MAATVRKAEICVVGHVTRDEVVLEDGRSHAGFGGAAYYAAVALSRLGMRIAMVTRMAKHDVQPLRKLLSGTAVDLQVLDSPVTTRFRNIYRGASLKRRQRVDALAAPFSDQDALSRPAGWFHFGPLTNGDMPASILAAAAAQGRVSLDVQGFVRTVRDGAVAPADWAEKHTALRYVDILKADLAEARILSGATSAEAAAQRIAAMGPKEVLVTAGADGAMIAANGRLYAVPAVPPEAYVDPTGCGDSFCAGYLFARLRSSDIAKAGAFAAAVASCKLAGRGPFAGTEEDIARRLRQSERTVAKDPGGAHNRAARQNAERSPPGEEQ